MRRLLLLTLVLAGGCSRSGDRTPSAACGLAALAGPTALLAQFGVPNQTLGSPPRTLPERLVVRSVAGQAFPAIVGRVDSALDYRGRGRSASQCEARLWRAGAGPYGEGSGRGALRRGSSRRRPGDRHSVGGRCYGSLDRDPARPREDRRSPLPVLPGLGDPMSAAAHCRERRRPWLGWGRANRRQRGVCARAAGRGRSPADPLAAHGSLAGGAALDGCDGLLLTGGETSTPPGTGPSHRRC